MAQQPSPTAIPISNATSPFPPAHPSAERVSLYEPDRRKSTLLATLVVQHCVLPSGYGAAITHVWIRNDGLFTLPLHPRIFPFPFTIATVMGEWGGCEIVAISIPNLLPKVMGPVERGGGRKGGSDEEVVREPTDLIRSI